MAINLDSVRQENEESLGILIENTNFSLSGGGSSDISGTFNNGYSVLRIRGNPVASGVPTNNNDSYYWQTDRFVLKTGVISNTPTPPGDVTGNFTAGFNITGVGNVTVPSPTFIPDTAGSALVTNAANELVPTAITPATNTVLTAATHTAVKGEVIFVDSTANTVEINPPTTPAPVAGDNFTVHVILGNNDVTINATQPITRSSVFGLLCVFIGGSWQTSSIASPATPNP